VSVAAHYSRRDVAYVEVTDADPAVVSLAWPRACLRPVVAAFIEAARKRSAELGERTTAAPPPTG
jgi:hypothetical protein